MSIFDEELRNLKEKILKMGLLVEAAIRDSIKSLVDRDSGLAGEVIKRDHQINALDVEIDPRALDDFDRQIAVEARHVEIAAKHAVKSVTLERQHGDAAVPGELVEAAFGAEIYQMRAQINRGQEEIDVGVDKLYAPHDGRPGAARRRRAREAIDGVDVEKVHPVIAVVAESNHRLLDDDGIDIDPPVEQPAPA